MLTLYNFSYIYFTSIHVTYLTIHCLNKQLSFKEILKMRKTDIAYTDSFLYFLFIFVDTNFHLVLFFFNPNTFKNPCPPILRTVLDLLTKALKNKVLLLLKNKIKIKITHKKKKSFIVQACQFQFSQLCLSGNVFFFHFCKIFCLDIELQLDIYRKMSFYHLLACNSSYYKLTTILIFVPLCLLLKFCLYY